MAVLDKHFDHVLIGKNFLSCMMALGLLKRNKKVLLIDDERLSYGENYLSQFGAWEKDFISTYAQDETIHALTKIEDYLCPISQCYQIENRFMMMGDSPFLNLLELMRKFPEFLPLEQLPEWEHFMKLENAQQEFDEVFQATIRRLAANSARFSGFERQPVDAFLNQCPENLQKIIRVFIERLTKLSVQQDDQGDLAKTFLYLTQALFHFQLKISCVPFELFHLFLSLICVQYKCDLPKLTDDLLDEFKTGGGQFKKTSIREWKFHKLRPWSIELASFDGIVHPQHVSFFGSLPEKMAIKCSPHFQGHRGVLVERSFSQNSDLERPAFLRLRSERTYVAKKEWIGTNFPWCAHRRTEQGLELLLPTPYQKGFKTSFVVDALHQFLAREIPSLLGQRANEGHEVAGPMHEQLHLSSDIWTESLLSKGQGASGVSYGLPFKDKLVWFDGSVPEGREKLKNISYFGPLNANGLGLISGLGDIKDYQHYQ